MENSLNCNMKEEIKKIIEDLTEDKISVSIALTKAKRINQKISSEALTIFIKGENGDYENKNLPEYRLVWGEPMFKFYNPHSRVKEVKKIPMPEATHFGGKSTFFRPILFSVAEIEDVIKSNDGTGTYNVLFTPGQFKVGKQIVAGVLKSSPGWELIEAYWEHSSSSFTGMLAKIKERLIDILLEIETSMSGEVSHEKIYFEKSQFDATLEIKKLIESAKKEIILVDGYVNEVTLKIISSKKENVKVKILTDAKAISESMEVFIDKFNSQYKNLEVKTSKVFHDRFLIVDNLHYYQIGASLKDAGNRTFALLKLKEEFMVKGLKEKVDSEWTKITVEIKQDN
jgi:hypothetical protein